MENILNEIKAERERQDAKWGEQNWPILHPVLLNRKPETMCIQYEIPSEERARSLVEMYADRGGLTYMHILIEEIAEAASCQDNTTELRKELIQSAAVIVAMIEALERNSR